MLYPEEQLNVDPDTLHLGFVIGLALQRDLLLQGEFTLAFPLSPRRLNPITKVSYLATTYHT